MPPDDPRYAEPINRPQINAMAVVLKALVIRNGGRIVVLASDLERAAKMTVRTEADAHRIVMELVEGVPPDTPRFESEAV